MGQISGDFVLVTLLLDLSMKSKISFDKFLHLFNLGISIKKYFFMDFSIPVPITYHRKLISILPNKINPSKITVHINDSNRIIESNIIHKLIVSY